MIIWISQRSEVDPSSASFVSPNIIQLKMRFNEDFFLWVPEILFRTDICNDLHANCYSALDTEAETVRFRYLKELFHEHETISRENGKTFWWYFLTLKEDCRKGSQIVKVIDQADSRGIRDEAQRSACEYDWSKTYVLFYWTRDFYNRS